METFSSKLTMSLFSLRAFDAYKKKIGENSRTIQSRLEDTQSYSPVVIGEGFNSVDRIVFHPQNCVYEYYTL